MQASVTGFGFLLGYIVLVGTASFLEKFSTKQLNPYQVNFLMAIGMAVTAVPALWIKQGSLAVPTKALTSGRAYRPLDGAWLNLFCVGTLGGSCRDGDGDFNQLCPRGVVPFLVFS